MKTTPKTEKEIAEANLLPKGTYPFTVGSAEEKTSKAGNEMLVVNLKVYRGEGFVFVKDYLMDTEMGAYKLRHIADACGVLASYESGNLEASELAGREGWVKIGIKKDKDGNYPDQNQALDYYKEEPKAAVKETAASASSTNPSAPTEEDDEIPF